MGQTISVGRERSGIDLLSGRGLPCFGHFDAMRCRFVAGDTLIQGFSDLLTIGFALQIAFISGATDEGNFREDRWHGGASQHQELGRLDVA